MPGNAKITMNDWISIDQTYSGILFSDMFGARILKMVVTISVATQRADTSV